jgi:hypothetical protein
MHKTSLQHHWLFILFSLLAFAIFLPSFTTQYAFHNDYTLLTINKGSWFGFIEARHLVLIGRALGAVLISSYCNYLGTIGGLAWSRFFSFIGMLTITAILYHRLQNKHGVSVFWSAVIAFAFLLLPANQVYVLWVANLIPGTLNVLLSLAAYQLLEKSGVENFFSTLDYRSVNVYNLIRGAIFFLAAFFIYPPTALFIFVLTFMTVIFSPLSQWAQVRFVVIRDILFTIFVMGVYWMLNGYIIRWAIGQGWSRDIPQQQEYQMMVGFPFWQKISLLWETTLASLSGPWHLYFGNAGAWLTGVFIICFGLIHMLRRSLTVKDGEHHQGGSRWFWGVERAMACIGLFLLMNLPTLVAKGVIDLLGYRVILPGMAMFFIGQFVLMQKSEKIWCENLSLGGVIRGVAILLLMMYGVLTAVNVKDVVYNYHRELQFLRHSLEGFDDHRYDAIVVKQIPKGETLIHRRMPLEFGFMITSHHHLWAVIVETAKRKPMHWPDPRLEGADYRFGSKAEDAGAYFIDLNEARDLRRISKNQFLGEEE